MDATAATAVKTVLEWRVREDAEDRFEPWIARLAAIAADAPGYEGSSVLSAGGDWFLLVRFATRDDLRRWQEAPATIAHLASAAPFAVRGEHTQERSGLETWFALPSRTAPAPPRWKMFVVSLAGIYVLQLVLNLAVTPLALPLPLRVGLVAVAVTALMTWLVMPRLALLLQDWLYSPPRRA